MTSVFNLVSPAVMLPVALGRPRVSLVALRLAVPLVGGGAEGGTGLRSIGLLVVLPRELVLSFRQGGGTCSRAGVVRRIG